MDGLRTAESRRRRQVWDEGQAREALAELARSGDSIAEFARHRGISAHRVYYWKKRIAEARAPGFLAVPVAPAGVGQMEIVADGVTIRVREDLHAGRLAEILEVVTGRNRGC